MAGSERPRYIVELDSSHDIESESLTDWIDDWIGLDWCLSNE